MDESSSTGAGAGAGAGGGGEPPAGAAPPDRREFMKKVASGVVGGGICAVPVGAGFALLADPLRRGGGAAEFVPVTTLDALPDDGVPRRFQVRKDRVDAWTRLLDVPVGGVYLRREPAPGTAGDGGDGDGGAAEGEDDDDAPGTITAFNVVCPHLGCPVDYEAAREGYYCPCHESTFGLDGSIKSAKSPSPRGLDALEVEVREGGEVWVAFQNFQSGIADKVPAG